MNDILFKNSTISADLRLYSLNVILIPDNLIRLGGRLQYSNFQFSERHSLIIVRNSKFTEL